MIIIFWRFNFHTICNIILDSNVFYVLILPFSSYAMKLLKILKPLLCELLFINLCRIQCTKFTKQSSNLIVCLNSVCSVQQLTVNFDTHIFHDLQSLLTFLFVQFHNWRSTLTPIYSMTFNPYLHFCWFSFTTDSQLWHPHIPWPTITIYISICSVQQLTLNFAAHIFHDLQPLSTFLFVQFNNWRSTLPPTYSMTDNPYLHFCLCSFTTDGEHRPHRGPGPDEPRAVQDTTPHQPVWDQVCAHGGWGKGGEENEIWKQRVGQLILKQS